MIFLAYFLSSFGLSYIIGHSRISMPFRQMLDPGNDIKTFPQAVRSLLIVLIECPACSGFWIGLAAALYQFPLPLALNAWEFAVVLPLMTCGSNYVLSRLTGLIPEES